MTQDRRTWRANDRVAHPDIAAETGIAAVRPALRRVLPPVVNLCAAPAGARDKQLVRGAAFEVLEDRDGWSFGTDLSDGYVGYLPTAVLAEREGDFRPVVVRAAHVYQEPDFKSPDMALLPFGALVAVEEEKDGYLRVEDGWMMAQHLGPQEAPTDWVSVAESFLGTPYLWGGNSSFGIDCSGLVQVARHAAGVSAPRDSDMQEAAFPAASGSPKRGDLVFWKGHVGIMASDTDLLHANAHHMMVAREPFAEAKARIGEREFGAVTKIARP
ncbi:MAG: C40 family peptidase [Pseudomonadota bacterium]